MSSSDENSYIALSDSPKEIETKIKKYAFSGGKDTIKDHRKKGGNPDVDVAYQYLRMLFEPDDKKLKKMYKISKILFNLFSTSVNIIYMQVKTCIRG